MWYQVNNAQEIDSPALLIGEEAVKSNIAAIKSFSDTSLLRPHVKTHKMVEVARLMLAAGIRKFKCATIAEAEMLALAGAEDILLAFQPNQVKAGRFRALSDAYKHIRFSCLVDNFKSASTFKDIFRGSTVEYYIDLNVGMNRTGIAAGQVIDLYKSCARLNRQGIAGIHAYDGHRVSRFLWQSLWAGSATEKGAQQLSA